MSIYNTITLRNIFFKKQAAQAFAEGAIDKAMLENIIEAHPGDLYSPNIFVRIGLGLLTAVIVFSCAGLLLLVTDGFSKTSAFSLFMAVCCYVALEVMCSRKKHKDSGVDIVLMAATALFVCFVFSMWLSSQQEDLWLSFILFILTAWFTYRFANAIAAMAAVVCLLVFVFNAYSSLGDFTIFSFPFILIAVSTGLYFFAKKQTQCSGFFVYYEPFAFAKIVALFAFYACGNYYVVDEIIKQNYLLNAHSALSASWFFWTWTFTIPFLYIVKGIRDKDMLLLRAGALLIVAAILTFRYYHAIIPVETALTIGGFIMIALSYGLMRYLRQQKHGFVYNEKDTSVSKYADAEAFALSQIASPATAPEQHTRYGGGSFGGAGSGSDY